MTAPTVTELLNDPTVQRALADAWADSHADDAGQRHEEGGWIFMDLTRGQLSVQRAQPGSLAAIDLNHPPMLSGATVVAKFHTHPNPTAEGWFGGPSAADQANAARHGVPSLIQADDGIYAAGPLSRRGGLSNGPGYPP